MPDVQLVSFSLFLHYPRSLTLILLQTHPDLKDWHETPFDFLWKRGNFRGDKHWQHLSHLSHKANFPLFTRLPGLPWARMPSDIWIRPRGTLTVLGVFLQIPFCLSLLWPWNFHFATKTEQVLWRTSAVYHALYTCFITLYYLLWLDETKVARLAKVSLLNLHSRPLLPTTTPAHATIQKNETSNYALTDATVSEDTSAKMSTWATIKARITKLGHSWKNISPSQDPDHDVSRRFSTPIFIFTVIYIFSHVFVYIEDIIALRSQPAGVYLATTQYFPLIR